MRQYEDNVGERVIAGDNIVGLQDGQCTAYKMDWPMYEQNPVYMFVVEVLSTGEQHAFTRPFTIYFRNGWPSLVWEISNGQLVAVPITRAALKQAGSVWLVEEANENVN